LGFYGTKGTGLINSLGVLLAKSDQEGCVPDYWKNYDPSLSEADEDDSKTYGEVSTIVVSVIAGCICCYCVGICTIVGF